MVVSDEAKVFWDFLISFLNAGPGGLMLRSNNEHDSDRIRFR